MGFHSLRLRKNSKAVWAITIIKPQIFDRLPIDNIVPKYELQFYRMVFKLQHKTKDIVQRAEYNKCIESVGNYLIRKHNCGWKFGEWYIQVQLAFTYEYLFQMEIMLDMFLGMIGILVYSQIKWFCSDKYKVKVGRMKQMC